jgi:hypothetical protein
MFLLLTVSTQVIRTLDAIRNYAVLNIIVEETKLFLTRERAPFVLCVEIYRPSELKLDHEAVHQEI